MIKKLTSSIILFFFINYFFSQQSNTGENFEFSVNGVITSSEGDFLEYATITLLDPESNNVITGGVSDNKGRFSVKAKKSSYNILIEYISFKNKILKNLRCLVCQGQTISDSNSDYAQIIKSVVEDKIQEGFKEKEVYIFLSEKYGDWILYDPPLKNNSYLLWFLPYLLFVAGGFILYLITKKRLIGKK